MTNDQLLAIGDWTLVAGLLPATLFLVIYGGFHPWYRSLVGWLFVLLGLAIVSVDVVVLLSLFLGTEYPGRWIVRVIGYAIHSSSGWALLAIYLVERRKPLPVIPISRKDHRA